MDDLILDFITETNESLGTLDVELIRLEQNPGDKDTLSNIFRLMHTIKGTCGFLGLPRLENIAHAGENVLGKIRDGEFEADPDSVTLILEVIDRIRMIMVSLEENGEEPEGDDADLKSRLWSINKDSDVPVDQTEPAVKEQDGIETDMGNEDKKTNKSDDETPETDPVKAEGSSKEQALTATSATGGRNEKQGSSSSSANQSIRVSVALLENLMTMMSELVLTRNQLIQLTRNYGSDDFTTPLQRLNQVVSELQEGIMKTRMQPIENAWSKLPRLVRDLSRELDKKIVLDMHGAETELDRQVLELIRDPLTHMVRNSADHGLESTEDRIKAGKSETGTITLDAYHEGGHIIIRIMDDGKGVNIERVKEKALANGLTTEEELSSLSEQQICQFIFKPGFSTVTEVTSVSGRGVGMDVVRSNIEQIGGHVEISSQTGKGSCFTIQIPLTLAIVAALIVESCSERFAIPQIAVKELVRISDSDNNKIEYIDGAPVLRLRDTILPLVRLREVLQLNANDNHQERFIVITRVGAYSFGILVDSILDTEEIVVKPVSSLLKDISVFSGNTILGDGSVVMILDPSGIASSVSDTSVNRLENNQINIESDVNSETMTLLLFRSGDSTPKAIPLSVVTRLEEVSSDRIESTSNGYLVQYRGSLMPLITVHPQQSINQENKVPIIVFTDNNQSVGMVVDEIIDIVTEPISIGTNSSSSSVIGSATINGKATEILNVTSFMEHAFPDWLDHNDNGMKTNSALFVGENDIISDITRTHLLSARCAMGRVKTLVEARNKSEQGSFSCIIVDADHISCSLSCDEFSDFIRLNTDTTIIIISSSSPMEELDGTCVWLSRNEIDRIPSLFPYSSSVK